MYATSAAVPATPMTVKAQAMFSPAESTPHDMVTPAGMGILVPTQVEPVKVTATLFVVTATVTDLAFTGMLTV